MFFKRFHDDNLARASYMIACEKTREAIIVDPASRSGRCRSPRSGYEKLFNRAFAGTNESSFVARVLEDQPVPPRCFAVMKRVNRDGTRSESHAQPTLLASVPIVLHCKGGGRSSIATSFLQANGIAGVSNLAGGYEGWVAEGFEVGK